jgi:hypothetical protein
MGGIGGGCKKGKGFGEEKHRGPVPFLIRSYKRTSTPSGISLQNA